jgi:hypothetical protein
MYYSGKMGGVKTPHVFWKICASFVVIAAIGGMIAALMLI